MLKIGVKKEEIRRERVDREARREGGVEGGKDGGKEREGERERASPTQDQQCGGRKQDIRLIIESRERFVFILNII